MYIRVCIIQGETIRREQQLVQAKDRELAQAQQQLRQQVSCVCEDVWIWVGDMCAVCVGVVHGECK